LIGQGADPFLKDDMGKIAFEYLIEGMDVENYHAICKILADFVPDGRVDITNRLAHSMLEFYVWSINDQIKIKFFSFLMSKQLDVDAVDDLGRTLLYRSVSLKDLELCRIFVKLGADPNSKRKSVLMGAETPLILAEEIVDQKKALLEMEWKTNLELIRNEMVSDNQLVDQLDKIFFELISSIRIKKTANSTLFEIVRVLKMQKSKLEVIIFIRKLPFDHQMQLIKALLVFQLIHSSPYKIYELLYYQKLA